MDGVNYLVPVDARLERDVDVRYETVTLEDLLASTLGASLRLVILDACRNNPLARSMQRTVARRSVSGGSFGDLNEELLGEETLVAYAAAAGTTAADGRGRNSPYTAALLAHLEQPLEIGLLFRRVRAQVLSSTNGQQRPHEYQSLVREHYLGSLAAATAVPVAGPVIDAVPLDAPNVDIAQLDIPQLRLQAEQGDARAQTELGERYEDGRGVKQNHEVAGAWFRRAAEQGHARGQGNLGELYYAGRGVPRDDEVARTWFRLAAAQGNARGQNGLGVPAFHRPRCSAGPGRSRSLVPPGGRASIRRRAEQLGFHVRHGSRRVARRLGGGPLVSPLGRAGQRPWAEQPRRDVPRRPRRGARLRGTPSRGFDGLPSRGMLAGRTTWAECTVRAAACRGTMTKPCDGSAAPLPRDTPWLRTTSAGCTRTAVACDAIASKLSAGIVAQQTKAIRGRRSNLIAFGERNAVERDGCEV